MSTTDRTCNGDVEVWLVCEAFSFSKRLAKHGLGRETFLRHKSERSSVLHVRNISSNLCQCWQSSGQVPGWRISCDTDYDVSVVHLLKIQHQIDGGIRLAMSVELAYLSYRASKVVNKDYVYTTRVRKSSIPRRLPHSSFIQLDVAVSRCYVAICAIG